MNGWKVTAIIFLILFILETIFMIWIIKLGIDEIDKENECSYNICNSYDSFYYDSTTNLCTCFDKGEAVVTQYIK